MGRPPCNQAFVGSMLHRPADRLPCAHGPRVLRTRGSTNRKCSRVIWCPSCKDARAEGYRQAATISGWSLGSALEAAATHGSSNGSSKKRLARNQGGAPFVEFIPFKERPMSKSSAVIVLAVTASFIGSPLSFAESGGGGGGSSAGGGAAGTGSAVGSPPAGSAGAGTAGVSGVPIGPGSAGGTNNSVNDPSGAGNAARASQTPGTNSAGTANSVGTPAPASSGRAAPATRAAGGSSVTGPDTKVDRNTDAAVAAENRKLDRMIKNICRGC